MNQNQPTCRNCGPTTAVTTKRGDECVACGRLLAPLVEQPKPAYEPPPIPEPTEQIPFVTATLEITYLPPQLAPPSLLSIRINDKPAFRLTPLIYARFHHACESTMNRLSQEDAAKLTDDLARILDLLLTTGIQPADIPQYSPTLPPLPPLPEPFPDLSHAIPASLLIGDLPDPNELLSPTTTPTPTPAPTPTSAIGKPPDEPPDEPPSDLRHDTRPTKEKRQAGKKTAKQKQQAPATANPSASLFD